MRVMKKNLFLCGVIAAALMAAPLPPAADGAPLRFGREIKLNDGSYRGTAGAFGGEMTVETTVAGGLVKEIKIISHKDHDDFVRAAERGVSAAIIEKQTLEVDAVSSATYTSYGIINGVRDALTRALAEGALPPAKELKGGGSH